MSVKRKWVDGRSEQDHVKGLINGTSITPKRVRVEDGSLAESAIAIGTSNTGLYRSTNVGLASAVDGLLITEAGFASDALQYDPNIRLQWTFANDNFTERITGSNLVVSGQLTHFPTVTDANSLTIRGAIQGDGLTGQLRNNDDIPVNVFSGSEFAMMGWVKINTLGVSQEFWGFSEGGANERCRCFFDATNTITFLFDSGSNYLTIEKSYAVVNVWTHLCVTFDGVTGNKVYVNGVEDVGWTYSLGDATTNWQALSNADSGWVSYYLPLDINYSDAHISNIIVLNRGLSAEEVAWFYQVDVNRGLLNMSNGFSFQDGVKLIGCGDTLNMVCDDQLIMQLDPSGVQVAGALTGAVDNTLTVSNSLAVGGVLELANTGSSIPNLGLSFYTSWSGTIDISGGAGTWNIPFTFTRINNNVLVTWIGSAGDTVPQITAQSAVGVIPVDFRPTTTVFFLTRGRENSIIKTLLLQVTSLGAIWLDIDISSGSRIFTANQTKYLWESGGNYAI